MIYKTFKFFGLMAFIIVSGCMSNSRQSVKTNTVKYETTQAYRDKMCGLSQGIFATKKEKQLVLDRGYDCRPKNKLVNKKVTRNWRPTVTASNAAKTEVPKIINITKSIESRLNFIGCNVGKADGVIDEFTRSGLYRFTNKVGMDFDIKALKDKNFLKLINSYPFNTCLKASASTTTTVKKTPSVTNSTTSNSAELQALRLERQQLEANLRSMEELIARQNRAANAPYKACLANCLLNNRAGSGFAAALSGIGQCNNSCAPLKYGGAVIPPSWERNQRRLKTIDCTITQMSRNQATARCNEF